MADGQIANILGGAAFVVSLMSLAVSIAAHRASGPRIILAGTKLSSVDDEWWLELKIANSGRAEVDLDGAWAGWLGSTITHLPIRLAGASSTELVFRGILPPSQYLGNAIAVQIGLGNGQTILKRLRLDEIEISMARSRAMREQPSRPQIVFPVEEV